MYQIDSEDSVIMFKINAEITQVLRFEQNEGESQVIRVNWSFQVWISATPATEIRWY